MKRRIIKNYRGDTIVEVLIAISIIGVILVGGYVATNSSLTAERRSNEHSVALQIAQDQIEKLRTYTINKTIDLTSDSPATYQFCIGGVDGHTAEQYNPATNTGCYFDSANTWSNTITNTSGAHIYKVIISADGHDSSGSLSWDQVKIAITWPEAGGGNGSETLQYQFYPSVLANGIPLGNGTGRGTSQGSGGTGTGGGTTGALTGYGCVSGSDVCPISTCGAVQANYYATYNASPYINYVTLPAGAPCVTFYVHGSSGGTGGATMGIAGGTGGAGGFVYESFSLDQSISHTFSFGVGQTGYGCGSAIGGGNGGIVAGTTNTIGYYAGACGGNGGGMSYVNYLTYNSSYSGQGCRQPQDNSLTSYPVCLLVAGGGGGGGEGGQTQGSSLTQYEGREVGGNAGPSGETACDLSTGGPSCSSNPSNNGGQGGTNNQGGNAGSSAPSPYITPATPGGGGGGNGAGGTSSAPNVDVYCAGGGGGQGYLGGGGGGISTSDTNCVGAGGGGGANYLRPLDTSGTLPSFSANTYEPSSSNIEVAWGGIGIVP